MALQVVIELRDSTQHDRTDRRKYIKQDISVEDTMGATKRIDESLVDLSSKLPPEDMLYVDTKELGVVYVGFREVTDVVDASMLLSHIMAAAFNTSQVTVG